MSVGLTADSNHGNDASASPLGTPARFALPTALLAAAVLTVTLIFAITRLSAPTRVRGLCN
jgi:hypothetical protein